MNAGMVVRRIGWRALAAAAVMLVAAEFAAVLLLQNRADDQWQRCYATRSEPLNREGCPAANRPQPEQRY